MEELQDEEYDIDNKVPAMEVAEEEESSDNETYVDEEIEDTELIYDV